MKLSEGILFPLLLPVFYSKTKAKSYAWNPPFFNSYLLKGEGPDERGKKSKGMEEKKNGPNSPTN